MTAAKLRRRIVHVVYSFGIGGLENVIVQLINRLPHDQFEHVVLSLTTVSDFKQRVERSDVQYMELNKRPGHAVALYPKIWKLFRRLRPDVVHSCNLAALEVVPLAWLAGVPLRIHAEHGWDAHDPNGTNTRYQRLRRIYRPFVSRYVAVSKDIDSYLGRAIGVASGKRSLIPNGVDTDHFRPPSGPRQPVTGCPFDPSRDLLVGTVGRLQTVKNQPLLARAFVLMLSEHPDLMDRARLVIVGEGPLRAEVEAVLAQANLSHLAWLPGNRSDVAEVLRMLSVFVLPSQTEGTSCTLQEAMASGLPVVATAVGGTPDLLGEGPGQLVSPGDVSQLANAMCDLLMDAGLRETKGAQARQRALDVFGIEALIHSYEKLFQGRTATVGLV
jgi:sugar transferase (PEP-CTERM/EpsH1 system associated)